MELTLLLDDAVCNVSNLKEYYITQIDIVTKNVFEKIEKYKYGVILEKYFFYQCMKPADFELSEKEIQVVEGIIDKFTVEKRDDGIVAQYRLKNVEEIEKIYELNPNKAHAEFVKLVEQPKILNDSTLMMILVRYEEAIMGIFRYILGKYPNAYLNDKTITYADLINMDSDIKEIKNKFIEKEIDEFMRQPISDWYNIFSTKHKADFKFDNNLFEKFKEIYYRRNLVVHNQGVVNEIYLKNVCSDVAEDLNCNDKLEVDKEYLLKAISTTQLIIYATFWGLRKISSDKQRLEQQLFDIGFSHMMKEEWELSKYIFHILMDEKEQSDASRLCNKINYWISVKNMDGLDGIKKEIDLFDVSAMSGQFKVAKYALLDDFEKISKILEEIIEKEIPACYVEQWPLFIQYRKSESYNEFRQEHKEVFDILGYQPEYISTEDEDEIYEEFCENMEEIE